MTDTTTSLDLDAIRYRLNEATPGPWGVGNGTHIVRGLEVTGRGSFTCIQSVAEVDDDDRCDWGHDEAVETDPEADARFIAAARQDIPALLAEVDRLRAELEQISSDLWHQADTHRLPEPPEDDQADVADVRTRLARIVAHLEQALAQLDGPDLFTAAEHAPATEPQYLIWSHHQRRGGGPTELATAARPTTPAGTPSPTPSSGSPGAAAAARCPRFRYRPRRSREPATARSGA
ncbi:hypothetical protein [Micromonospora cathayae]|uniref:Uncharacterized protein n=1 Tax=Micromonospora cathayae TaxID=3028804 RepID=A0ABY7ZW51_9ACTN|nr:hypothetical protein [Micromonospora sp. HUAS 3]WDZ87220.1 hypothetical protein PVK37_12830 [Micromonospora sp. HUAS 3]